MGGFVSFLIIGMAFFAVVAVIYLVTREQREHDAHTRYVRSPYRQTPMIVRHADSGTVNIVTADGAAADSTGAVPTAADSADVVPAVTPTEAVTVPPGSDLSTEPPLADAQTPPNAND